MRAVRCSVLPVVCIMLIKRITFVIRKYHPTLSLFIDLYSMIMRQDVILNMSVNRVSKNLLCLVNVRTVEMLIVAGIDMYRLSVSRRPVVKIAKMMMSQDIQNVTHVVTGVILVQIIMSKRVVLLKVHVVILMTVD